MKATAATSIISGSASADAIAIGGSGGNAKPDSGTSGIYANGGSGGAAKLDASNNRILARPVVSAAVVCARRATN